MEARDNIFYLHSFITGRNELIASWNAENIHIYLVATLALVLSVPLTGWRNRLRIGALSLAGAVGVTLALCVVQLSLVVEDYASARLGITVHTAGEKLLLHAANRALVLVGMMLLPAFLFLISYLSLWSESPKPSSVPIRSRPARHSVLPQPRSGWPIGTAILILGGMAILAALPERPTTPISIREGLRHLLVLNPTSARAHLAFALASEEDGNLAEAGSHYRKSLELDPELVAARFNLGNVLLKEGNVEEATRSYEEVLKRDPRHLSALNNLGRALYQQGLYPRAEESFEAALRVDEAHASTQQNLGLTLARLNRPCEALPHFRRGASLDPAIAADPKIRERIASVEADCRNHSEQTNQ